MARILTCGFELNTTTNNVDANSHTTTGSVSSTTVRSGSYAARANPTNSQKFLQWTINNMGSGQIYYFRFYVYIASYPSADSFIADFSGSPGIKLTTTGALQLFVSTSGAGAVQAGSNSKIIPLNEWHRVEFLGNFNNNLVEGRLDGYTFGSGVGSVGGSTFTLGVNTEGLNNSSADIFFDDVAVNDNSGGFQNSYPGEGKVIVFRPNAAGDSNGFLTQIGGTAGASNNFTRVNEVTPDDATSYNGSAVLSAEDLFNVDASAIQGGETIKVVSVGVRMADLVGVDATAAFKLEIEKAASGTKTQSSALIPNSTSWLTNGASPRNYPITTYLDPDGNPWTQTTLDSMQIGYIQTATNVQTIAISNVWAVVEYVDPSFKVFNKYKNVSVGDGMGRSEGAT